MAEARIELRAACFAVKCRPIGNFVVPLDQRGQPAAPVDDVAIKFPYVIDNRPVVTIDQKPGPVIVLVFGMSGKMNLADVRDRETVYVFARAALVVGAGNIDVVDASRSSPQPVRSTIASRKSISSYELSAKTT